MNEHDNKHKERWQDRRKGGYNWKRLLVMTLLLVAIFVAIRRIDNIGKKVSEPTVEVIDSTAMQPIIENDTVNVIQ